MSSETEKQNTESHAPAPKAYAWEWSRSCLLTLHGPLASHRAVTDIKGRGSIILLHTYKKWNYLIHRINDHDLVNPGFSISSVVFSLSEFTEPSRSRAGKDLVNYLAQLSVPWTSRRWSDFLRTTLLMEGPGSRFPAFHAACATLRHFY